MKFIYLIILFPLFNLFLLLFLKKKLAQKISGFLSIITIILEFFFIFPIVCVYYNFISNKKIFLIESLWKWITVDNFIIPFSLKVDNLSLCMLITVLLIGLFTYLYSIWYIKKKNDSLVFFFYINLFIASISLMILSNNFLLLYIGWELISLCSYFFIGFYTKKFQNVVFATTSFVIIRFSDIMLLCAILILYKNFNTLDFDILHIILDKNYFNFSFIIHIVSFMILVSAIGKSSQIPFHIWLSNAMVGPIPASALIHSSTMIVSGVYIVSKIYWLFKLTPIVLSIMNVIGLLTLFFSSCFSLMQYDIKKILAYSTMSQIGYMFVSLAHNSVNSAIFHIITHAFCKALLFFLSGSLIARCNFEQNIFVLRNLYKHSFSLYILFFIGSISLSGFPVITSIFYSKRQIFLSLLKNGNIYTIIIYLLGIFLTPLYIFRMFFIIFNKIKFFRIFFSYKEYIPLFILSIFSIFLGKFLENFVNFFIPVNSYQIPNSKYFLEIISFFLPVFGIFFSWLIWKKKIFILKKNFFVCLFKILYDIFYFFLYLFDYIYTVLFIKLYLQIIKFFFNDPIDKVIYRMNIFLVYLKNFFSQIEIRNIQQYICVISLIIIIFILFLVFFSLF